MEEGPSRFQDLHWIAVFAIGNALSIALLTVFYQTVTVLADFRDPMLYALLCSIALRGPKNWLVQRLNVWLSQDKTMLRLGLYIVLWPWLILKGLGLEAKSLWNRWNQAVDYIRAQHQKKVDRRRRSSGNIDTATPGENGTPGQSQPKPTPALSTFKLYLTAGMQTLQRGKDRKRRRKRASVAQKPKTSGGDFMLIWLFWICLGWGVYEWIMESWSSTLKILVLTVVGLMGISTILLEYLTSRQSLSGGIFPQSPTKSPGTPWEGTPSIRAMPSIGHTPSPRASILNAGTPNPLSPRFNSQHMWTVPSWLISWYTSFDVALRSVLRAHLHSLVTLVLVLALLVGSTGTSAFLSARIVQEGRSVVLAARDAFPASWAEVAAATPLLSDVTGSNGYGASGAADQVVLPPWAAAYSRDALDLAQRSLPSIASWVEERFHGFLDSHNLTHALGDMRLLYESLQGKRKCSDKERQKLLIVLAKAELEKIDASRKAEQHSRKLEEVATTLNIAVVALSAPDDAVQECSAGKYCKLKPQATEDIWSTIVAADIELNEAKEVHMVALERADAAQRGLRVAEARLALCSEGLDDLGSAAPHRGLAMVVGEHLQSAYTKLWHRQFKEGMSDLRQAVVGVLHGNTPHEGTTDEVSLGMTDLPALLQRLLQVASVPLTVIGRVVASSVGSTTAAAFMGSMGLLRLGLGVVNLGLQAVLFITLLYYLLAAEKDPLTRAAGHLPLSDSGKKKAVAAINKALGGVFLSMLKLAALHALLTWFTYRALGVPLVYTSVVASAAFSLLPFVPTYAVALPGALVLIIQGRLAGGVVLLAVHVAAYYVGDALVLEESGDPMLVSLAILGGLWAFSNPLLGCLLGPILLSLLSAVGGLLTDLLVSDKGKYAPSPTAIGNGEVTPSVRRPSIAPLQLPPSPTSVAQPVPLDGEHSGSDQAESAQSFSFTRRKLD